MLNLESFLNTQMGKAVKELSEEADKRRCKPVTLNVIGGCALILREKRDPEQKTDIDYVGERLDDDFLKLADEIGQKHNFGKDWINNDGMLSGISREDFEFATGKLHFDEAFSVGNIKVNVLQEEDILRMKIIAVDTSLAAMSLGGEFTRMKDLPDIMALMKSQNKTAEDLARDYEDYIINDNTIDIIEKYEKGGEKEVMDTLQPFSYNDIFSLRARKVKMAKEKKEQTNLHNEKEQPNLHDGFVNSILSGFYKELDKDIKPKKTTDLDR